MITTPENEKKTKEFIFDKLDGDKGDELIYIGIRGWCFSDHSLNMILLC